MTDQPTTYAALADRFPASAHKTKTIGGRALTYVDGEMVISRLNEVLGLDGWSFEIKDVKVLDDEVWALGRMTVYQGERTIVREQAGGQIINRNKAGEIIELGNDIKGAVTDCLKKCASLLGVGLYLFNVEERREVEAEMRDAKRPAPTPIRRETPKPEPTPKETVRAREMVPPALPDAVRAEAIRRYRAIAKHALEDGHPDGDAINGVDPEGLSSKMLGEALSRLQAKFPKAWKTLEAANG